MPVASTYHPRLTTRELLISVQNADEARVAFQCGVTWVDLKNPASGSLGRPTLEHCHAFLKIASHYPERSISLALGEYADIDWLQIEAWQSLFPLAKFGLAGFDQALPNVEEIASRFSGRLVPALYADWHRARAPRPALIARLAQQLSAPYLLVDTFIKDGRGLFEWMSVEELQEVAEEARTFGAELVVAGSLRISDWDKLDKLGPVIVGVRGAVCHNNADRTSQLNSQAIEQWLSWCHS